MIKIFNKIKSFFKQPCLFGIFHDFYVMHYDIGDLELKLRKEFNSIYVKPERHTDLMGLGGRDYVCLRCGRKYLNSERYLQSRRMQIEGEYRRKERAREILYGQEKQ